MWNRWGFRVKDHASASLVSGLVSVGIGLTLAACGGKNKNEATTAGGDTAAAVPKVDPTLCDTSGKNVVTYDLNKDGRPDVWRLYKSEQEGETRVDVQTCKQVDFDHDGRKDWVVGYNRKGGVLFEKADLDYDGKFDMSAIYDPKTGKVVEVERDSDFDGKYDLKEIYDSAGVLSSVRRDRNADNSPDVWEQYKEGQLIAILYDDDGDNKVDRREEVPGTRPKVEMPEPGSGGPAEATIPRDEPKPAPKPAGTTPGSATPPTGAKPGGATPPTGTTPGSATPPTGGKPASPASTTPATPKKPGGQ